LLAPRKRLPSQGTNLLLARRLLLLPGETSPSSHWEVPSTPPRKPTFSRNPTFSPPRGSFYSLGVTNLPGKPHLLPIRRFIPLLGGNQPSRETPPFPCQEVPSVP